MVSVPEERDILQFGAFQNGNKILRATELAVRLDDIVTFAGLAYSPSSWSPSLIRAKVTRLSSPGMNWFGKRGHKARAVHARE